MSRLPGWDAARVQTSRIVSCNGIYSPGRLLQRDGSREESNICANVRITGTTYSKHTKDFSRQCTVLQPWHLFSLIVYIGNTHGSHKATIESSKISTVVYYDSHTKFKYLVAHIIDLFRECNKSKHNREYRPVSYPKSTNSCICKPIIMKRYGQVSFSLALLWYQGPFSVSCSE